MSAYVDVSKGGKTWNVADEASGEVGIGAVVKLC